VDALMRRQIVKKVKKHLSKGKDLQKKGFTFEELRQSLGYCDHKAYDLLHEWARNEEVTLIKVPTTDLLGRKTTRTCYSFAK